LGGSCVLRWCGSSSSRRGHAYIHMRVTHARQGMRHTQENRFMTSMMCELIIKQTSELGTTLLSAPTNTLPSPLVAHVVPKAICVSVRVERRHGHHESGLPSAVIAHLQQRVSGGVCQGRIQMCCGEARGAHRSPRARDAAVHSTTTNSDRRLPASSSKQMASLVARNRVHAQVARTAQPAAPPHPPPAAPPCRTRKPRRSLHRVLPYSIHAGDAYTTLSVLTGNREVAGTD
jgi:hypothetical protein